MKLLTKKLLGILMLTILLSSQSYAGLIQYDLNNQGDELQFKDEETGLVWLDLRLTDGRSIANSLDLYQGHRVATEAEVASLFRKIFSPLELDNNSAYNYSSSDSANTDFVNAYSNFALLAGSTYRYRCRYDRERSCSSNGIGGLFQAVDGNFDFMSVRKNYSSRRNCNIFGCGSTRYSYSGNIHKSNFSDEYEKDDSYANSNMGVFLVEKSVSIPEPSIIALFLLSLFGIRFSRVK